jgi:hypothetical protein
VIGQSERSRVLVRDFTLLAARTPATRSLMEISGGFRPNASFEATA